MVLLRENTVKRHFFFWWETLNLRKGTTDSWKFDESESRVKKSGLKIKIWELDRAQYD